MTNALIKLFGLYRPTRADSLQDAQPYFYWDGSGQSHLRREEFLKIADPSERSQCLYDAPGFLDYLGPRADLNGTDILLRDLKNIGRLFELLPVGIEGQSDAYIKMLFDKALPIFSNVIPESEKATWILQFFLEDETSLAPVMEQLKAYINPQCLNSRFTEDWLGHLQKHLEQIAQDEGLFFDHQVSGNLWRARMRRVRLCLWRDGDSQSESGISEVSEKLKNAFAQAGMTLILRTPGDLYQWLSRWFAPTKKDTTSSQVLPWKAGTVGLGLLDDDQGDIVSQACSGVYPASEPNGNWYFRGQATRFICFDSLATEPPVGLFTAEQVVGKQRKVLWDSMPPEATLSLTVQFCSQTKITEHLEQIMANSRGGTSEANAKYTAAAEAQNLIAAGHKLYRVYGGIFVRAETSKELKVRAMQTEAVLSAAGLRVVAPQYDLIAQDCFLRALPFSFSRSHDRRAYIRRSRLWYADHIQRVAPIFGRSTGTGNPGFLFWNRGAQPLTFDILNPTDRKRNAHMLMLGPTGSGKTATLIYLLLQAIAVHRPRLFIITSLPTFGLFSSHLERLGLQVNHISMDDFEVSLPPFANATKLLSSRVNVDEDHVPKCDLLAEMEAVARLMITGGDAREEADLRRADMSIIRRAIIKAAEVAHFERRTTKVSDVVSAMRSFALSSDRDVNIVLDESARKKLIAHANAMDLFCQGTTGDIFDGEGSLWQEADVTVIELGMFAKKDYQAQLSVAIISLLHQINEQAERYQYDARQLVTVIDEAHILLKNSLVAPMLNNIMAMWRTFGAWLWLATQTLSQFPEHAREMLNQPEWMLALSMDQAEVDHIARFKNLSADQKTLLLSAKKAPGDYVEGVVISDVLLTLFRSVMPSLSLALAQTEKSEKAVRAEIMKQYDCDELSAAYRIAERIYQARLRGANRD